MVLVFPLPKATQKACRCSRADAVGTSTRPPQSQFPQTNSLFGSLETTRLGLGLALDSLEISSLRMSPAALVQPNSRYE